jgi:hypothetical protein
VRAVREPSLEAGGHGVVRLDEPGALSPTGVERGGAQTIGQIEDAEVPGLISPKLVGGIDEDLAVQGPAGDSASSTNAHGTESTTTSPNSAASRGGARAGAAQTGDYSRRTVSQNESAHGLSSSSLFGRRAKTNAPTATTTRKTLVACGGSHRVRGALI